ncbi:Hypothetical predicted protein [Octopus vulgaris]|uniref:Uncharacterized protein n=1 Tax=Octopus vulgaris TaxID=6645 RepID=A0AA36F9Y9_OCTVU|nr:Hypothetical predicted protein [Octopus vulgaris]
MVLFWRVNLNCKNTRDFQEEKLKCDEIAPYPQSVKSKLSTIPMASCDLMEGLAVNFFSGDMGCFHREELKDVNNSLPNNNNTCKWTLYAQER